MDEQVFFNNCESFLQKLFDEQYIQHKIEYMLEGKGSLKSDGTFEHVKVARITMLYMLEPLTEFMVENVLNSDGSDYWSFWECPDDDPISDLYDYIVGFKQNLIN